MKLTSAMEDYLMDCRGAGFSPATVDAYRLGIAQLAGFMGDDTLLGEISAGRLRAWLAHLRETPSRRGGLRSQATVHQYYRSVRTFFAWCVRRRLLASDPFDDVMAPPEPQTLPRYLSLEEMSQIMDALAASTHAPRDLALGLLMMDCGIRREEVASLTLADVSLSDGTITIRKGKGNKGRVVPMSSMAKNGLRCWLAVRPKSSASLFGLKKSGIYEVVKRAAKRAGIKITPHGLRHTFATHYDGPLDDLQKILGHKDVTTTVKVYRHRSTAHILRHHEERSPLAVMRKRG